MRAIRVVGLCAALGLVAGCANWLDDPKTTSDPNTASNATPSQLFTAMQANINIVLAGPNERLAEMWSQRMAGTDRQLLSYGNYQGLAANNYDADWTAVYDAGGLVDIRKVEAAERALGDRTYLGIARVFEAMVMGTAADMWGDVPYSGVLAGDPIPALDAQSDVYAHVQAVLDSAIADFAANAGPGPGDLDLSFGGDATKWAAAAHTLKARYYMHTAKVVPGAYALVATEAALGISNPANDLKMYSSSKAGEENLWFQFYRERAGYMNAGKFFVDMMTARNDPRKAQYFAPAGNGQIGGADPNVGLDPNVDSWLSATRGAADFLQPIATADETSLLLAEAQARAGASATAVTTLNTERTRHGLANVGALTGNALLMAILDEKYVATFQTYEGYADYRRTCYPNLTPAPGATQTGGNIPARVYYASVEETANPNIPSVPNQPARNAMDATVLALSLDGTACKGQK